mgnify:CR=1 FL=1
MLKHGWCEKETRKRGSKYGKKARKERARVEREWGGGQGVRMTGERRGVEERWRVQKETWITSAGRGEIMFDDPDTVGKLRVSAWQRCEGRLVRMPARGAVEQTRNVF